MRKIFSLMIALSLVLCMCGCGGSAETEIDFEYVTTGGHHAEVYAHGTINQLSCVTDAIDKLVPGAETDKMSTENIIVTKYDDGIHSIDFTGVTLNGVENCGGEVFLEFEGDEAYKVHYLQVSNTEYCNDGINIEEYEYEEN